MQTILGIFRFFLFVVVTGFYIIRVILANIFTGNSLKTQMLHTGQWSNAMLKTLGVKVTVQGTVPAQSVLYLPNHRSYIDAVVTAAYFYNSFVIKAEVSKWPLMGAATKNSGHIFVNRNSDKSREETREKVKARLLEGYSVTVFPEGTTFKGPGCMELKPGMFYAAAEAKFPIVPVAIEYKVQDDAWVGADTFVPHFIQCFGKPVTEVTLRIGPVIQGDNPLALKQQAETWIQQSLKEMRATYDKA
jgi:lyso-ornithine lipid O-acyltransferase